MSALTCVVLVLALIAAMAIAVAWAWRRTFDAEARSDRAEHRNARLVAKNKALTDNARLRAGGHGTARAQRRRACGLARSGRDG